MLVATFQRSTKPITSRFDMPPHCSFGLLRIASRQRFQQRNVMLSNFVQRMFCLRHCDQGGACQSHSFPELHEEAISRRLDNCEMEGEICVHACPMIPASSSLSHPL